MISNDVFSLQKRSSAVPTATLRVDMFADLVCPWCWLGKRRLDEALGSVHGPSIVNWNPFELNPEMPAAGVSLDEYLESRFGDAESVRPQLEELSRAGKAEGLEFRFDRMSRVPNTLDAHRLMLYAESRGIAVPDMAESIFSAFFEDGRDISDRDVLLELGVAQGLDRGDLARILEDEHLRQIVMARETQARRGGITGVPNFLVNDRLFVVGAQPAAALVDVFDRAMFGAESDQPLQGSVH